MGCFPTCELYKLFQEFYNSLRRGNIHICNRLVNNYFEHKIKMTTTRIILTVLASGLSDDLDRVIFPMLFPGFFRGEKQLKNG